MSLSPLFKINGKLESSLSLVDGRIYAVIMSEDDYVSALTWSALMMAVDNDRPAWLVSDDDPQRFLSLSNAFANDAKVALASDQVSILMLDVRALQLVSMPLHQVLDEFDSFKVPEHALIVIDRANIWFDDCDFEHQMLLIQSWRDWAEKNKTSLLLLFRPQPNSIKRVTSDLIRSAHLFGGVARMHHANDVVRCDVLSWFGMHSISVNALLRMNIGENGQLIGTHIAAEYEVEEPALDEDDVFAMESICLGGEAIKNNWHYVNNIDNLLESVAGAVAATIILGFDRSTLQEQLGRTIYALRQRQGGRIKIIVRELNAHLRYVQESLINKLGANLIIPAGLGYSRFLSMVSMVQGQRFSRIMPISYEDAVASTTREEQSRGYLPPHKFVAAVSRSLDFSHSLSVPNALIALSLTHGLTPVDAIRYCNVKRNGDFCTADQKNIYVFLSACREGDVDIALRIIMKLPISDLFSKEARYFSIQAIRSVTEGILAQTESGLSPNLADELAAISAQGYLNGKLQLGDTNVRLAPTVAKRRPLLLRTQTSPDALK